MPLLDPSLVEISPVVYDFIFIQINDGSLSETLFNYNIFDPNGQIVRKGQFKGLLIQLRLSHLKDGKYALNLSIEEQKPLTFFFEKKTTGEANDVVIKIYPLG